MLKIYTGNGQLNCGVLFLIIIAARTLPSPHSFTRSVYPTTSHHLLPSSLAPPTPTAGYVDVVPGDVLDGVSGKRGT